MMIDVEMGLRKFGVKSCGRRKLACLEESLDHSYKDCNANGEEEEEEEKEDDNDYDYDEDEGERLS
jgi:hypothetical protein